MSSFRPWMSRRGVPPLFNAASVKHDMLFTPALSAGFVYISISTNQKKPFNVPSMKQVSSNTLVFIIIL